MLEEASLEKEWDRKTEVQGVGKEAKENVLARTFSFAKMGTCAVGACRLSDDVLISAEHESNG